MDKLEGTGLKAEKLIRTRKVQISFNVIDNFGNLIYNWIR